MPNYTRKHAPGRVNCHLETEKSDDGQGTYVFNDGFVPLQNGKYLLAVESIQEGQGKYGPVWEFSFIVIDGDREGTVIRDFVHKGSLSIHSKIGRYYRRIMGKKPYKGMSLDLGDMVGKKCYGYIILEAKYEDGKKKLVNKITRLERAEEKGLESGSEGTDLSFTTEKEDEQAPF